MQDDLFGDDAIVIKNKRKETWEISVHACKVCMGKILIRKVSPTVTEVMCSECGIRSYGNESVLCWCGKTAGLYGKIFRCHLNENKRPESPSLVLVSEIPVVIKPIEIRPDRHVYCPDSY